MNVFYLPLLADEATTTAATTQAYYVNTYWWFERMPPTDTLLQAAAVLLLVPLIGHMIARMFREFLVRNQLRGPLWIASFTVAIYAALWVLKMRRFLDPWDVLALSIHRVLFAIMLLVGLWFLDRLVIVPVLTRGGKVALPRFVHQIIMATLYALTVLAYCSTAFGWNINSFLAGAGVVSLVVGLALQETLGNFFSGMVMQASSPFVPGDWIECHGVEGRVVDMTWRSVTLHTPDDNYALIPNSVIAKERIVNYCNPTKATARNVKVGLEYHVSPNDARAVLLRAAVETEGVLATPEPRVFLEEYADSAIVYRIKFWLDRPQDHPWIENAVRTNIWYRLKQAGYGIPFPMRTVEMVSLDRKQARLAKQERAARAEMLRDVKLLAGLSGEQREMLAEDARDVALATGQVLYRQDEAGDSFFILREGKVESSILAAGGKTVTIAQFEAGDFFGEYSAMTGQARPTTTRALTDIKCIEITRQHLQALFMADPALMTKVSEVVAQRAAQREEKMREGGAKLNVEVKAGSAPSVLDRMKRVFGKLQVEVGKVGKITTSW